MDEPADQFLKKVRFLSLINADITYLPEERQFYFDKAIQPVTYSFLADDGKLLVEFNHQVDFTLRGGWVVHERMPQGRIVGFRTIEYSNVEGNTLEAPKVDEVITVSTVEEAAVEVTNEPAAVEENTVVVTEEA